jgi:hypothetical protein
VDAREKRCAFSQPSPEKQLRIVSGRERDAARLQALALRLSIVEFAVEHEDMPGVTRAGGLAR